MFRSQLLLTSELNKQIRQIAAKQQISQSEAVRQLLTLALGMKEFPGQKSVKQGENQYFYDLATFPDHNQRIAGFKEIFLVGGRTTEIKIISDTVFRYYLQHRQFPPYFESQLIDFASDLQKLSPNQTLAVRRAYVVPGFENPPGPRFIGLKLSEVIKSVQKIYDFAIKNRYHLPKKSQIVVFLHAFLDPKPLSLPIKLGTILPYGGYSVPLNQKASRVEIFAVWGNNEGVQSFDAIDRYVVDTERGIILTKDIPQKNLMLCTTLKSQSDQIKVPVDKQFAQILSDQEILEVGRVVKELSLRYGLRRVEFSFDGTNGIIFNESAKYEIAVKNLSDFDKQGIVKIVYSQKEIEELKKLDHSEITKTIVYIDKKIVTERAYDLLNHLAGLSQKFTILYPGLSATAHSMRVLNDFGHNAVVVGNRVFKEGQEILVKVIDGQIAIEDLSQNQIKNYLINLYDAKLFGVEKVGGKANNLSLLKSKGFNVPHGWVITTSFFDQILAKDSKSFTKLWRQISKHLPLETAQKYAIRSSATVEDHKEHSFAGQFATYLNIPASQVKEKVLQVMQSALHQQVTSYLTALGQDKPIKMAVVIQEMVQAKKAGVSFGKDIQTGNEDHIVIDVTKGLGEGVVSGVAKTQTIIYSRSKNQLQFQNSKKTKPILTEIEINSLIEMTINVERLMARTQDIEWAIDHKGNIWLLQSRDL